ncbi:MAG: helix-hairpin-helix domain-containing protein [Tannerella sp.]|jgi:hypothetical protein|nr:helix-hairpin-helix domain-containing protein [Tannerella sp.]
MKRWLAVWSTVVFVSWHCAYGQENRTVEKWIEYVEALAEETDDDEQMETLYAELSYLAEHPYNLNTVTAEMLKRLPFLSDGQIDSIIAYRQRYGKMATVYELKNIEALDWSSIDMLLPFVYAGDVTPSGRPLNAGSMLKYGKQEIVLRYDRTFPLKQGYEPVPDSILLQSPNRRYLGEPFYHSVRYSYAFDDRVQAGLVMEKDAGEPFMNARHRGYDYYSVHLLLRNTGWLKTLVVGDYKASFGQGLALSHDFNPRMSMLLSQTGRRNNGFRRHYSTGESGFFRGAASTVSWKDVNASFFYSYRKEDASVEDGLITSFKTDGLHRVPGDLEKKNTVSSQVFGGNVRYDAPAFAVGLTALTYDYGALSVAPEPRPYNLYYFRGSRNVNASVDYQFRHDRIRISGETAVSKNGAWATLNAVHWAPASYLSGLILFRSYARDYQAYWGSAFAQNSSVQNEQGLYVGLKFMPLPHWSVSGYADFFRFPWLKYEVDAPSSGSEYMVQADYAVDSKYSAYLRYRYRRKESGRTMDNSSESEVLPYGQHRLRGQFVAALHPALSARAAVDVCVYDEVQGKESRGQAFSLRMTWQPGERFQADLFAARFHTDDYDSRISSYEKKQPYVYNSLFLYGEGFRCAAVVRYFPVKRLALYVKAGWTHYTDRDTIGSGLETIEGKNRTDISLMTVWMF